MAYPEVEFTIGKPGKGILLLVETTNTPEPSPEFAAEYLRFLYEVRVIPSTEYFLLALPSRMYLWRNPNPQVGLPDFEADTAAALSSYSKRLSRGLDQVGRIVFQMMIDSFLWDLVSGTLPDNEGLEWIKDSGLAESVLDASIRINAAA